MVDSPNQTFPPLLLNEQDLEFDPGQFEPLEEGSLPNISPSAHSILIAQIKAVHTVPQALQKRILVVKPTNSLIQTVNQALSHLPPCKQDHYSTNEALTDALYGRWTWLHLGDGFSPNSFLIVRKSPATGSDEVRGSCALALPSCQDFYRAMYSNTSFNAEQIVQLPGLAKVLQANRAFNENDGHMRNLVLHKYQDPRTGKSQIQAATIDPGQKFVRAEQLKNPIYAAHTRGKPQDLQTDEPHFKPRFLITEDTLLAKCCNRFPPGLRKAAKTQMASQVFQDEAHTFDWRFLISPQSAFIQHLQQSVPSQYQDILEEKLYFLRQFSRQYRRHCLSTPAFVQWVQAERSRLAREQMRTELELQLPGITPQVQRKQARIEVLLNDEQPAPPIQPSRLNDHVLDILGTLRLQLLPANSGETVGQQFLRQQVLDIVTSLQTEYELDPDDDFRLLYTGASEYAHQLQELVRYHNLLMNRNQSQLANVLLRNALSALEKASSSSPAQKGYIVASLMLTVAIQNLPENKYSPLYPLQSAARSLLYHTTQISPHCNEAQLLKLTRGLSIAAVCAHSPSIEAGLRLKEYAPNLPEPYSNTRILCSIALTLATAACIVGFVAATIASGGLFGLGAGLTYGLLSLMTTSFTSINVLNLINLEKHTSQFKAREVETALPSLVASGPGAR